MLRRALIYCLTTLIAVQSVMAMADAHQLHQSGQDHLSFNHDHSAKEGDRLSVESEQRLFELGSTAGHDCHHCCHCHGMSPAFLAGAVLDVLVAPAATTALSFPISYASIYKTPDNPPPI